MKELNTYLKESILGEGILGDLDDIVNNSDQVIKDSVIEFIKDNYSCKEKYLTISEEPNTDGKYIVDYNNSIIAGTSMTSLTNGYFKWGKVKGRFDCAHCESLTSLEGAPEEVEGDFNCMYCKSLKTLEGAPREVSGYFDCAHCESLTSLEGAPKEVGGDFICSFCDLLTSLKGAPKKVGGSFWCQLCHSLKSLKGAPKEVRAFYCYTCDSLKTLEGAPERVEVVFNCNNCDLLTSLKGAPKYVGGKFYCQTTPGNKHHDNFTKEEVLRYSNVKGDIITY